MRKLKAQMNFLPDNNWHREMSGFRIANLGNITAFCMGDKQQRLFFLPLQV